MAKGEGLTPTAGEKKRTRVLRVRYRDDAVVLSDYGIMATHYRS